MAKKQRKPVTTCAICGKPRCGNHQDKPDYTDCDDCNFCDLTVLDNMDINEPHCNHSRTGWEQGERRSGRLTEIELEQLEVPCSCELNDYAEALNRANVERALMRNHVEKALDEITKCLWTYDVDASTTTYEVLGVRISNIMRDLKRRI